MNFGRQGFRNAGMKGGFFRNHHAQFRAYSRMNCFVNMQQMNMMQTNMSLIQV
jgi:hypothetical protein